MNVELRKSPHCDEIGEGRVELYLGRKIRVAESAMNWRSVQLLLAYSRTVVPLAMGMKLGEAEALSRSRG